MKVPYEVFYRARQVVLDNDHNSPIDKVSALQIAEWVIKCAEKEGTERPADGPFADKVGE